MNIERVEAVKAKFEEVVKRAEIVYKMNLGDVELIVRKAGFNVAGRYEYHYDYGIQTNRTIVINLNFINDDSGFEHVINDTVAHEVAHVIDRVNRPNSKPHNKHWRSICENLGGTGETYHSVSVSGGKTRKTFKYCVNGDDIELGAVRHRRLQNGSRSYNYKGVPINRHDWVK